MKVFDIAFDLGNARVKIYLGICQREMSILMFSITSKIDLII
jgi:hypothetical protein